MVQTFMQKKKMVDLLYELIKNSKRSDRELAKIINVSQPTITRMRKNLEKSKLIQEYTVIPDLGKLGFEILAFTFLSINPQQASKEFQKGILENQKILFASFGRGANSKTALLVSIHKDFTDFSVYISEFAQLLGADACGMESFLVSLKTDFIKNLSFKNLERINS